MPSHSINGAIVVPTRHDAPSPKQDAQSSGNSTEKSTTDEDIEIKVATFSRDSMTGVTIDEYVNDAQVAAMLDQLGMTTSFSASIEDTEEKEQEDKREKVQIAFKCIACNSELPCMFITVGFKSSVVNETSAVKPSLCKGERIPEWKHEYTIPYVD
jgi:hypothetical protein